ncbi:MAG: putative toxin-antitoxin system toxin component, PIN family [Nitrospirae bacterium]|nr:putative toxin-antitoxin system toxin component, PIN family [Nitrospirota bacterium]
MAKKEAVRVFLDSNVILSGLLSDKGAPRIILDIFSLRLPFLTGVTGRYNIIEIERNLAKKMPKVIPVYREYLPKINLEIIPVPSLAEVRKFYGHISDKDIPVIVSAINGKADIFVTGDKKDFTRLKAKGSEPLKIVSPSEFIDIVFPDILKNIKGRES